jgi:hypothetical protein
MVEGLNNLMGEVQGAESSAEFPYTLARNKF